MDGCSRSSFLLYLTNNDGSRRRLPPRAYVSRPSAQLYERDRCIFVSCTNRATPPYRLSTDAASFPLGRRAPLHTASLRPAISRCRLRFVISIIIIIIHQPTTPQHPPRIHLLLDPLHPPPRIAHRPVRLCPNCHIDRIRHDDCGCGAEWDYGV